MARYVDANNISLKGIAVFDQDLEVLIPLSDVRKALQMTPTADVAEIRHGYWIEKNLDDFRKVECSCSMCGWSGVENYDSYVDIHDFEFCPYCGAKMDGEE